MSRSFAARLYVLLGSTFLPSKDQKRQPTRHQLTILEDYKVEYGALPDLVDLSQNPRHRDRHSTKEHAVPSLFRSSLLDSRAVGRVILGVAYRFCLRVQGMGDHNAVDVCQVAHEGLLHRSGVLDDSEILRYGEPVPRGPVWQGVYVDDWIVVRRLARSMFDTLDGRYAEAVRRAEEVYAETPGIDEAQEKVFSFKKSFLAWGTQIGAHEVRVAIPLESVCASLCCWQLLFGSVTLIAKLWSAW